MQGRLVEGNAASARRVIVYEDLACGDCAIFRALLDLRLLPRFGGEFGFEHREFPLAKHVTAGPLAVAARYFGAYGPEAAAGWRRYALRERAAITPENLGAQVEAYARRSGFDPEAAVAALDDAELIGAVEADRIEGVAAGVRKTPTVLAGPKMLIETFQYEELVEAMGEMR